MSDPGRFYEQRVEQRLQRLDEHVNDLLRAAATGGVMARRRATGSSWSSSSTTTPTALTASVGQAPSIAIVLSPRRLYRASFRVPAQSTSAGDRLVLFLAVDGTDLESSSGRCETTATTQRLEVLFSPADRASHTYSVRGRVGSGGAGTVSLVVSSTSPAEFTIEDVGPAA